MEQPDRRLPEGWLVGCRPEDRELVDRFGTASHVATVDHPIDGLPAGYPACTAVLHPLPLPDGGWRRWLLDADDDPWAAVVKMYRVGLPELGPTGRFIGDNPLWHRPTAVALADMLDIVESSAPYTCAFWPMTAHPVVTLTGAALRRRLGQKPELSNGVHGPLLWVPHDHRWVACTPYDEGCTYVSSDEVTAGRLRRCPHLETLPCRAP